MAPPQPTIPNFILSREEIDSVVNVHSGFMRSWTPPNVDQDKRKITLMARAEDSENTIEVPVIGAMQTTNAHHEFFSP